MTFRPKSLTIEAVQFVAGSEWEISEFCPGAYEGADSFTGQSTMCVPTWEGFMSASLGDWIIKDSDDRFRLCKPELFDATYEPA